MKLTIKRLKQIIKEEMETAMVSSPNPFEQAEAALEPEHEEIIAQVPEKVLAAAYNALPPEAKAQLGGQGAVYESGPINPLAGDDGGGNFAMAAFSSPLAGGLLASLGAKAALAGLVGAPLMVLALIALKRFHDKTLS